MNLLLSGASVGWLRSRKRRGLGVNRYPNLQATKEGKEREPLFLKPRFPNCGATKHKFRWDKVALEELQDYIHVR